MKQRNTVQKQLILQCLAQAGEHPSAEMLYQLVRRQYPEIGLATVYRNLNRLEQEGKVRRLSLKNQPDRFDGNLTPHFHLQCTCCGRVEDVFGGGQALAALQQQVQQLYPAFEITGQELVLYGLCAACRRPQEGQAGYTHKITIRRVEHESEGQQDRSEPAGSVCRRIPGDQ